MWFNPFISSIDIENAGDSVCTWFWKEHRVGEDGREIWTTFRRVDQEQLEIAENTRTSETCVVNGGRCEVSMPDRALEDRYGVWPPRQPCKVRRALWFRLVNGKAEPYEEEIGAWLEHGYAQMIPIAQDVMRMGPMAVKVSRMFDTSNATQVGLTGELSYIVTLPPGENQVKIRLIPELRMGTMAWKLQAQEESASLISFGSYVVKRSFGPVPIQPGESEEQALSSEVGRVFVLVHGIGEKLWSAENKGLSAQAPLFRQHVHQSQLIEAGFKKEGDRWKYSDGSWNPFSQPEHVPVVRKDEILEASWWQSVHTDELDVQLRRITLKSMPAVRQIANCAIADAMFYMQGGHRETIVKAVVDSIEGALQRFRLHHPTFDGDVVLIAHSLGGVIVWDILRHRSSTETESSSTAAAKRNGTGFSFAPRAVFTLGSPVAMFMHCADDVPKEADYVLPNDVKYFNIFHPLDPLGYRMETLFRPEYFDVPPSQVPHKGLLGDFKLHHGAKKLISWASGEDLDMEEKEKALPYLHLNAGERVDWCVQEDMNVLGGAGEILQALPSHGQYFVNPDVAAFIERACAKPSCGSEGPSLPSSSSSPLAPLTEAQTSAPGEVSPGRSGSQWPQPVVV